MSTFLNASQVIEFDIDQVQCNNVDHPYVKFYGSPCTLWKNEMSKRFQKKIHCAIHHDSEHDITYSCIPTFGRKSDTINIHYEIQRMCTYKNCQYKLTANAGLYDILHPLQYLVLITFSILVIIKYRF